jgi:predicted dehydrogenase
MDAVRMAQYGTGHGHAPGKLRAMLDNPGVELVGVYEPDEAHRRGLAGGDGPYRDVHWFASEDEMLGDPSIRAVASEGLNAVSLAQTEAIVCAGKHVWYDKPAGEDWERWLRVVALARERDVYIQMGYMFRYHEGFCRVAEWVKSGLLGKVFGVRAHMSTRIPETSRRKIGVYRGGIFYDLAGHMLDQIVWLLGRPERVTSFLRNDDDRVPGFADNTLAVLEYGATGEAGALAFVDIAAMEPEPKARRYEVYGTLGSAILLENFEHAARIRLCLERAAEGYHVGEQVVPVTPQSRQSLYELELDAFLATISGRQPPDRTLEHELLVQETLLRATGAIPS